MYLRKATRRYKDKTYTNHVLVESVRTPKGPRQNTICNLGDLAPRPRAEWLELAHKIEQALSDQPDLLAGPADRQVAGIVAKVRARQAAGGAAPKSAGAIAVLADQVTTERHREVGPVHVGLTFWRRLGLDRILEDVGLDRRSRELTCAMTLNRLIAPRAEHAMPDWFRRTALDDLLDLGRLGEDPLYANMDRLYPQRRAIEAALVARERNLFSLDPAIYLYDLTSTYFEGQALASRKAKQGYSRDKRPDCKQVLVALAVGREGFPVGHEILAGNSQDRATLEIMLDRLADPGAATVGLEPGATVVVDRGMAFAPRTSTSCAPAGCTTSSPAASRNATDGSPSSPTASKRSSARPRRGILRNRSPPSRSRPSASASRPSCSAIAPPGSTTTGRSGSNRKSV